jgi:histidinol-phosphatase (PHP family)
VCGGTQYPVEESENRFFFYKRRELSLITTKPARVSVHGGHSGQFCNHATGSLEEIVVAYIEQGFSWVGITEHMPPAGSQFLYPEERQAGLTEELLRQRFGAYMREGRRLQKMYRQKLTLFVAMEIETYQGAHDLAAQLIDEFQPDYLVGSVHHVNDIPFDYSQEEYDRAARHAGGIDALYCRYFDEQYLMLQRFSPAVVGHFDLIRLYDPDYRTRLEKSEIADRIGRNLDFIKSADLILDYNLRSLLKGADEPYVSASILEMALARDIAVVPGDDSHGVDSIGVNIDSASALLQNRGFDTKWRKPKLFRPR